MTGFLHANFGEIRPIDVQDLISGAKVDLLSWRSRIHGRHEDAQAQLQPASNTDADLFGLTEVQQHFAFRSEGVGQMVRSAPPAAAVVLPGTSIVLGTSGIGRRRGARPSQGVTPLERALGHGVLRKATLENDAQVKGTAFGSFVDRLWRREREFCAAEY